MESSPGKRVGRGGRALSVGVLPRLSLRTGLRGGRGGWGDGAPVVSTFVRSGKAPSCGLPLRWTHAWCLWRGSGLVAERSGLPARIRSALGASAEFLFCGHLKPRAR